MVPTDSRWARQSSLGAQRRTVPAAIVRGGFPELHANPDIDTAAFYSSHLATFLERDVRTLAHVGNLRDFERFIRACAMRSANLLNIRSAGALKDSPAAGAVWETYVCAQLRHRERRAGRSGSLFFWRDRTREVDFVVDVAGRLQLFEAKWTELPASSDTVNLGFVRNAQGPSRVTSGAVVCQAPNAFPVGHDFHAMPVADLCSTPCRERVKVMFEGVAVM